MLSRMFWPFQLLFTLNCNNLCSRFTRVKEMGFESFLPLWRIFDHQIMPHNPLSSVAVGLNEGYIGAEVFPRFGLEQYAAIDHVAPADDTNRYVPEPCEERGRTALSAGGLGT